MENDFIIQLESSIKNNWDAIAITEFDTKKSLKYSDVAREIFIYHYIWTEVGLKQGDKIAICAKNSSDWVVLYLSIVTGGYIFVSIPNNLSIDQIQRNVSHSGCRLLYTDNHITDIGFSPTIDAVIDIHSKQIVSDRRNIGFVYSQAIESTLVHAGDIFSCKSLGWKYMRPDDTEAILYTSGTTSSYSKAVIQSFGFVAENLKVFCQHFNNNNGDSEVCIIPFFHVLGVFCNVIAPLCSGMKIIIMNSLSPEALFAALQEYKPRKIIATPLLLLKTAEMVLGQNFDYDKFDDEEFCLSVRTKLINSFGGSLEYFVTGGAPVDSEFEALLVSKIHFPIVPIYGLTECGIVSMGNPQNPKIGSSGLTVTNSEIRIESWDCICTDEFTIGEIQLKGNYLFSGYYNNFDANLAAFTSDGWFKTGDLGYIDDEGNLFITGRCKDMLLTSNGENIYPEETESTMNAFPYVKESILVQRGEKLYAIVVPDREKAEADGLDAESLNKKIDEAVREASKKLPGFTIISGFELRDEPLERTPKGSLKRYLYSDGIKEN